MTLVSLLHSTGDIALLNCTAIVNTSNESLNDKNPVSDSVHQLAGPELREELLKLKGRDEEEEGEEAGVQSESDSSVMLEAENVTEIKTTTEHECVFADGFI